MTKRYYYTDPLAAAWQLKHFGMRVTRTHCHRGDGMFGESIQPIPMFIFGRDIENQVSDAVRYYIHPDSLHLLEPQPKDLVFYGYGVYPHAREVWDEVKAIIQPNDEGYPALGDGDPVMLLDGGDFRSFSHLNRIIQRNGIAFHWPESEEV